MRITPERKADTRQQADLRAELHAAVDRMADRWPQIQFQAGHRGWPTNLRQDEPRGRGELTSVEAAANHPDPYSAWLTQFMDMRAQVRTCADRAMILDPPKKPGNKGRDIQIENCELCGQPIVALTRRINGLAYHAGPALQPWCWYQVTRSRIASTPNC